MICFACSWLCWMLCRCLTFPVVTFVDFACCLYWFGLVDSFVPCGVCVGYCSVVLIFVYFAGCWVVIG